jgi:hypothetical protein
MILLSYLKGNRFTGTYFFAFPATDTFQMVWGFLGLQIHFTIPRANTALYTLFLIKAVLEQGNFIAQTK